jgi:hypothetical protein
MNISTIWNSKFSNYCGADFFNEIEFDKLDEAIGFQLLTDQESLAQWRQKMYVLNHRSNIPRLS